MMDDKRETEIVELVGVEDDYYNKNVRIVISTSMEEAKKLHLGNYKIIQCD